MSALITGQLPNDPKSTQYIANTMDGNYPFSATTTSGVITIAPFWGNFSVSLHDFIRQNYHKNLSDRYPFFPHNGKLPDFLNKLPHFKFSAILSIFIFPSKVTEQCIEKNLKFCNFWNRSFDRNECF